jgi:hypothetical protein
MQFAAATVSLIQPEIRESPRATEPLKESVFVLKDSEVLMREN